LSTSDECLPKRIKRKKKKMEQGKEGRKGGGRREEGLGKGSGTIKRNTPVQRYGILRKRLKDKLPDPQTFDISQRGVIALFYEGWLLRQGIEEKEGFRTPLELAIHNQQDRQQPTTNWYKTGTFQEPEKSEQ